jgi:hypothetical protein
MPLLLLIYGSQFAPRPAIKTVSPKTNNKATFNQYPKEGVIRINK